MFIGYQSTDLNRKTSAFYSAEVFLRRWFLNLRDPIKITAGHKSGIPKGIGKKRLDVAGNGTCIHVVIFVNHVLINALYIAYVKLFKWFTNLESPKLNRTPKRLIY